MTESHSPRLTLGTPPPIPVIQHTLPFNPRSASPSFRTFDDDITTQSSEIPSIDCEDFATTENEVKVSGDAYYCPQHSPQVRLRKTPPPAATCGDPARRHSPQQSPVYAKRTEANTLAASVHTCPHHCPPVPQRTPVCQIPRCPREKWILVKEDGTEWSSTAKCCYGLLLLIVQVLMFGALALVFVWVFHYRGGVAWHDDISREFNLHPLLMVTGFVFLLGQAILVYRELRCCSKIYNKLLHTILHLLVVPAAAIAAIAVFDFHGLSIPPIPDLYSLHSWMGLATLGLFCLQFVVGFVTFLLMMCRSSAGFRAAVLPLHVHFGLATFLLGIATCLTGLTEKAIFQLRHEYSQGVAEGRVINALGLTLIALAILLTYIVRNERFRLVPTIVMDERL